MPQYTRKYSHVVITENLLAAWEEFLVGKKNRRDVAAFQVALMDNVLSLRSELLDKRYVHGGYSAFNITDPKPRNIHKATVRDRLLHHLLYTSLYPYFDTKFIGDSYSCRNGKGTHRAIRRFEAFVRKVSHNHTKTCWVLKCDIRKFFASIDHEILKRILCKHIQDQDMLWLLGQVIDSFGTDGSRTAGLPLGNLTSQLLVNVYMNEFDQFVKRRLKVKRYIRYADDFVVIHENKAALEALLPQMAAFLETQLRLSLHPKKVFIKTVSAGVDFLGWVNFEEHRVLRTSTRRRMMKSVRIAQKPESISSYKGMLSHGNGHKLKVAIDELVRRNNTI